MSKRKQRRDANKPRLNSSVGYGFDFGQLPRIMLHSESSFQFNHYARAANITGCAYGFDRVEGFPSPIPCLSIVGEDATHLQSAAECLAEWGCAEDGDAVDMNIVLKRDGGYLLGVQPDFSRLVNRTMKDRDLSQLLYAGATWIKTMDSTNPMLLEWKEYLESRLAPIKIMLATAKTVRGVPEMSTITRLPDAVSFVKFRFKIETEDENPTHWFFDIVRKQKSSRRPPSKANFDKPETVALSRMRVIDSAFPVSRERIRRSDLPSKILRSSEYASATQSQIEQALINIHLSRQWTAGLDHYAGMDNLKQEWWQRIANRVELCRDENLFPTIPPATIAKQIALDVEHTLRTHGAAISQRFITNQRLFLRLGYGGV